MANWKQTFKQHRHTLAALAAAAVCFAVFVLAWYTAVRGQGSKALSARISDDYSAYTTVEQSVSQTFAFDDDLIAMAFVFGVEGEQPAGTLELTLTDASTGEVLAQSTGDMAAILPGQYTGLGLDRTLTGGEGRSYTVTLTPHYKGAGRLSVGHSAATALWQQNAAVDGAEIDGTLALLVTYRQIGGFLTLYYWLAAALALAVVFFGVRSALRGRFALHRLVFVLVLALGVAYTVVLPPYGAPDEKYHINQSFTLACRWANVLSDENWQMGHVPISMSYRREHDVNAALQDQETGTTVWAWQAFAGDLFTLSPDAFDSHAEYQEAQTDENPLLYLPSAAAVFLAFVLRLGFVPALVLGRLANLACFALLAAAAVKYTPFGRRVFAAAALLPMTLHLAASFSRDSLLLGLCFAFAALAMRAAFAPEAPGRKLLAALAAAGLLMCPGKAVYLPLALLVLCIPGRRLALPRPALWKAGYLAACLALTLALNSTMLGTAMTGGTAEPQVTESTAAAQTAVQAGGAALTTDAAGPAGPAHGAPEAAAAEETPVVTSEDLAHTESGVLVYREDLAENTLENYVRRLYWYAEGAEAPEAEVTFWADALRNGDTTFALLSQSFFFSPQEMEQSRFSDRDFAVAMCYAILNRQPHTDEPDSWASAIAENGRIQLFKAFYSTHEIPEVYGSFGITIGTEDSDRYPLDRAQLAAEAEANAAVRESQSVATGDDAVCYTPGYILAHPADTLRLLVNSVIQNGDHYIRTLVGGSLGYYTMDLAWGWVAALYLLLAWAALPAKGEALPGRRARAALLVLGGLCCALSVAGCLTWTPTYSETLYGLQGRYFLPVLPAMLTALAPRSLQAADGQKAGAGLVCALCVVNAGVLLNTMLAVIAL